MGLRLSFSVSVPAGRQRQMARYRILYWGYIPIGVKATDVNETVRENLPARFQEAFESAAIRNKEKQAATYTTSNFRWGEEQIREGSAATVAGTVAKELDETWNEEEALALFEQQSSKPDSRSLDLKKL
jgi:hypothetical protein